MARFYTIHQDGITSMKIIILFLLKFLEFTLAISIKFYVDFYYLLPNKSQAIGTKQFLFYLVFYIIFCYLYQEQ